MDEKAIKEIIRNSLTITAEIEWGVDGMTREPTINLEIGLRLDGVTFDSVKINKKLPKSA